MGRLDGKGGIITGGGSGIGEATAKLFAKEGAKVVVADTDPAKGQRVTKEIKDAGGDAIFVQVHVSKVNDMERMVKTTVQTYGKLNTLFNHAGMPGPRGIESVTEDEWERYIKVNLLGRFFAIKFAIPEMIKAGVGCILFTASGAGIHGDKVSPTYAIAKGGVVLLSRSLALILAKENIRVNCICPRLVDTPMALDFMRAKPDEDKAVTEATIQRHAASMPMGRSVQPEEVASAALFLAWEAAQSITGVDLLIGG